MKALEISGCTSFQGYLFSKPVPVEEFEVLLHQMRQAQSIPVVDLGSGV
jgi:EAL domain-containing protein (putative c-di-GMP-specific phosphodiesterase class I)